MGEAGEVSRGQSLWVLECQAQECGPGSEGSGSQGRIWSRAGRSPKRRSDSSPLPPKSVSSLLSPPPCLSMVNQGCVQWQTTENLTVSGLSTLDFIFSHGTKKSVGGDQELAAAQ